MYYYFCFFVFLLFLIVFVKNRRLSVFFALFFSFVFSSIRFNAGYDFPVYYLYASGVIDKDFEFFSELIIKLSQILHPQLFFIITSFLLIFLVFKIFILLDKGVGCSRVSIIIFCSSPIAFLDSFGTVRQFLAVYLFLFSLVLLLYGKKLRVFFIYFPSSVLLHKSAIIFSPLMVLNSFLKRKLNIYFYVFTIAFSYIFGPELILYISEKSNFYYHYFSTYRSDNGHKLYLFFFVLLVWMVSNIKIINENVYIRYIFNIFFIGMCFFSAVLPYGIHIARFSWFFIAIYPFLIGCLLERKKAFHKIYFVFLSMLMLLSSLYFSSQNSNRDFLNNYQPFFMLGNTEASYLMIREYNKFFDF